MMKRRGAILILFLVCCFPGAVRAGETEQALRIRNLYQSREIELADRMFSEFRDRFPESAQLCPLLLKAGQAPRPIFEARQKLEEVVERCPDTIEEAAALAELATLQHLSGNDRAAYLLCREFMERFPEHPAAPNVLLLKGALELQLPAGSTPDDSYAMFLKKYPGHPGAVEALVGLGDSRLRREQWEEASRAYLEALSGNPQALDLPRIYYHLGLAADKLGRQDEAQYYYREVIRQWEGTTLAWRAKERLDNASTQAGRGAETAPLVPPMRYAVAVGQFPSLMEAEKAAKTYIAAGLRVHYILEGKRCELLVGEFSSATGAETFSKEIAGRYHVKVRIRQLP